MLTAFPVPWSRKRSEEPESTPWYIQKRFWPSWTTIFLFASSILLSSQPNSQNPDVFPGDFAMEFRHCLASVILFTFKLINHKSMCMYVTCTLCTLSYNNKVSVPKHPEHSLSSPGWACASGHISVLPLISPLQGQQVSPHGKLLAGLSSVLYHRCTPCCFWDRPLKFN